MEIDFSIQATGDNLQFQWQKDGSDLSEGGKYCGTDTDTLRIVKMEKDDKGRYRCIVKNDYFHAVSCHLSHDPGAG